MADSTRITDLPENITMQMNTGNARGDGMNTSYSPIDIHPNPYGHPPPSVPSMPTPSAFPKVQQRLPSRDIPMDQSNLVQDQQVQANYIPPVTETVRQTAEYMKQYDELTEKRVSAHIRETEKKSKMDTLYDEGQIPVLVAVLFFIFHMPIVTSTLYKYVGFLKLHDVDGHFNMYGLIWQSSLFSAMFYSATKMVDVLANL
jgi:hypothetical protein